MLHRSLVAATESTTMHHRQHSDTSAWAAEADATVVEAGKVSVATGQQNRAAGAAAAAAATWVAATRSIDDNARSRRRTYLQYSNNRLICFAVFRIASNDFIREVMLGWMSSDRCRIMII